VGESVGAAARPPGQGSASPVDAQMKTGAGLENPYCRRAPIRDAISGLALVNLSIAVGQSALSIARPNGVIRRFIDRIDLLGAKQSLCLGPFPFLPLERRLT
jgi:hypothetical protein